MTQPNGSPKLFCGVPIISKRRLTGGLVLLVALMVIVQSAAAQRPRNKREVRTESLQKAALQVLNALRFIDVRFLSSAVDTSGIVLGIDGAHLSAAEFRRDLAQKGASYCALFSCNGEAGVRDVLSVGSFWVEAKTENEHSPVEGTATLHQKTPDDWSRSSFLSFSFAYRDGRWRLTQIEYP